MIQTMNNLLVVIPALPRAQVAAGMPPNNIG